MIEQLIATLPENTVVFFYRTNAGAEIDLLFFDRKNQPVAIEIKYSLSPALARGFWIAYDDLGCQKGFVVYPGGEMYPVGKEVFALPVGELGRILE